MADVIPHFCTGSGCEALHGGSRESDEVKIAKIGAERDIEVARLARSEAREEIAAEVEQTEIVADAAIEQTAIAAEATVDEAVVQAEVLEEVVNPEPDPVQVEIAEPEGEPEAVDAPPEVESAPEETKSTGWWSGYR